MIISNIKLAGLCLMVLTCWAKQGHAQLWAELFQQKKTQIKYLTQQIAALQVYIGYVEKGYHIAQQGLTAISDIKNGEFNLHTAYFNSLKAINPSIRKDARIAEIIAMQLSIVQQYKKCYRQVKQSTRFNSGEVSYVYSVFTSLLGGCANDITDLISLTTAGKLQLTDDERISRIGALYSDMQDKYSFVQDFSEKVSILALSRMKEQNDAGTLGSLYHHK